MPTKFRPKKVKSNFLVLFMPLRRVQKTQGAIIGAENLLINDQLRFNERSIFLIIRYI